MEESSNAVNYVFQLRATLAGWGSLLWQLWRASTGAESTDADPTDPAARSGRGDLEGRRAASRKRLRADTASATARALYSRAEQLYDAGCVCVEIGRAHV